MWLLVYGPAVLGVLRYRRWSYWRWVCALLVWQAAAQYLFSGGGTLEAPAGDGLVSRLVRRATDDGPAFALYAIGSVVIFYGGVAYFVRQLYLDARSGHGAPAATPRKALEIVVLTLACSALLYSTFTARRTVEAQTAPPSERSLEAELDKAIIEVNKRTPLKLDDVTILTGASREGRTILYDYAISVTAPRQEISDYLRSGVAVQGCASKENQAMLQAGATIRYRYRLASGGEPLSLDITTDLCRRLAEKDAPPQKNSSISR